MKLLYDDTVESYFSTGAIAMQSKQMWDKDKGVVIGEDDEFISFMTVEESWWDDNVNKTNETINRTVGNTDSTHTMKVDAKYVLSRDIHNVDDNATLPSLKTKTTEMEEDGDATIHDILSAVLTASYDSE